MKKWLTIFPTTENVHLVKDVGMIPYILQREFQYDCTLATYKMGDYPYLETEVRGLKLSFIRRRFNMVLPDMLIYLLKNRKQYDILQLYHLNKNSLLAGCFFKLLHFGKVKVHLKLDANDLILNKKESYLKKTVMRYLLRQMDLVSVETLKLQKFLSSKWKLNFRYIPNGFFDEGVRKPVPFHKKENLIITVGRIGLFVKATDILCEAFRQFAKTDKQWTLHIIGPVEPSFNAFIDEYFRLNPELKSRVKFVGAITDRDKLWDQYVKAKIFVLPSRWEGFALVFLEAARAGCYIISSAISSGLDITDQGQLGSIFPIDDARALSKVLQEVTSDPDRIEDISSRIQHFVYDRFYWPELCRKIDAYLNQPTSS